MGQAIWKQHGVPMAHVPELLPRRMGSLKMLLVSPICGRRIPSNVRWLGSCAYVTVDLRVSSHTDICCHLAGEVVHVSEYCSVCISKVILLKELLKQGFYWILWKLIDTVNHLKILAELLCCRNTAIIRALWVMYWIQNHIWLGVLVLQYCNIMFEKKYSLWQYLSLQERNNCVLT